MATIEENLTRVYTINLGKAWITPQYRRTDRVVNMIREFAKKHMKSKGVRLDQDLNRQIWSRGKTNPPRKVRVKMVKDEGGIVTVSLYEDVAESAETTTTTTTTTVDESAAAATEEKKEDNTASPADTTTTTTTTTTTITEQSKEETKTGAAASK